MLTKLHHAVEQQLTSFSFFMMADAIQQLGGI
jgi:hypothetical protein